MEIEPRSPTKRRPGASSKGSRPQGRVSFAGTVLRVLDDENRTLLLLLEGNGLKLRNGAQWFKNGAKLRGSDPISLTGTVTSVGPSSNADAVPVSMSVTGYTLARVTLSARHLRRVA